MTILSRPARPSAPAPRRVRSAVKRAVSNDDLVSWTWNGGRETRYTRAEPEDLRYLHIWLSRQASETDGGVPRELIEWAYHQYRGQADD